ncbi:MAG: M42 family metallopeptidase [Tuberibacillus sp.]
MEELLRELTSISGACGFEHDVARFIAESGKDWADDLKVDGLGNVIVTVKGKQPGIKVALSAHMDQVGFIVKKIESNGLIKFEKLGGHDDRLLPARKVAIKTQENSLKYGVIGTLSAHMMKFDDPHKVRNHRQLYIDVGVDSAEEVRELGIEVGDSITYVTEQQKFGKNRVIGKGFDDRAGCAVLFQVLKDLDREKLSGTVYGIFSVQEEVGLRGAKTGAYQLDPDVSLAIDTTAVSDTPEEMMDNSLALGKGPGIKVMDFSLIASVHVRKALVDVAKNNHIPYQLEVFPGIGTDAGEMHLSKEGVPSSVLSIPSRYAHSAVEVIDLNDLENTKKLLQAFLETPKAREDFSFLK